MDYQICEEVIKKHSKSFYFAFSRLPKRKAQAVYAIYTFCRQADDSMDKSSSKSEKQSALMKIKKNLDSFKNFNEPDEPMWRALRDVFLNFDMSLDPFYDQLEGQMMDYHFQQPENIEDLDDYSYHVAGSVGLMLLPIIATENYLILKSSAVSLGIAMQITNILRDIGEDIKDNQRIYIPKQLMQKYQYNDEHLKEKIVNESFVQLWEDLAKRAETRYKAFETSIHLFDTDSQFQVLLASKVYGAILESVRKSKYDCFSRKNSTTLYRKLCLFRETLFELKTIPFTFSQ